MTYFLPEVYVSRKIIEPSNEIMVRFVLRKRILQTRMRSHLEGLDVWLLVGPFVYFPTLCVRRAKALARLRRCGGSPEPSLVAYVIKTIISWAGSIQICKDRFSLSIESQTDVAFHNKCCQIQYETSHSYLKQPDNLHLQNYYLYKNSDEPLRRLQTKKNIFFYEWFCSMRHCPRLNKSCKIVFIFKNFWRVIDLWNKEGFCFKWCHSDDAQEKICNDVAYLGRFRQCQDDNLFTQTYIKQKSVWKAIATIVMIRILSVAIVVVLGLQRAQGAATTTPVGKVINVYKYSLSEKRFRGSPIFEPPHDKTNKVACAPSEDSDQPGHPPSLIRVFVVRSMDS